MNVGLGMDVAVSGIAAASGEPARARMLYHLLDGHARTSTELAVVAEVSASTASVHLGRLKAAQLVTLSVQGKHRYYRLQGPEVAKALEALSVLAADPRKKFVSRAPGYLRAARTCYDHMAGALGVALHDQLKATGWLSASSTSSASSGARDNDYDLNENGARSLEALGIDVAATRLLRRRFAFACMDWSERRFHLGGAIGAALLDLALNRKWLVRELDSRALSLTTVGRREMLARFGVEV
jgi:DNA-binding transcriptional ArsR family regulator